VEKKIVELKPKMGRPRGTARGGDKGLTSGNLTIKCDADVRADLELLRAHYRQVEFAPIIRMAIAQLARMARAQEKGEQAP
jgi:hypothetical protein